MNSYITGWFDDFKNQMNNLPNVPADLAPDTNGGNPGAAGE